MSFKSGSVGFHAFDVPSWPVLMEDFQVNKFPGVGTLGKDPISGFTVGDDLYDTDLSTDRITYAGYPFMSLVKAERKVPTKLLQAECRQEEKALMRAEGRPFIRRQERSEIKSLVMDRLQPTMPPTLSDIPFVYDEGSRLLFASLSGDSKMDAFRLALNQALGTYPRVLDPEGYIDLRGNVDPGQIPPMNITGLPQDMFSGMFGCEFLTWMMYRQDIECSTCGSAWQVRMTSLATIVRTGASRLHRGRTLHSAGILRFTRRCRAGRFSAA